jgi:hypothetical protein
MRVRLSLISVVAGVLASGAAATTPNPTAHLVVSRIDGGRTWLPGAPGAAAAANGELLVYFRSTKDGWELETARPPFRRTRRLLVGSEVVLVRWFAVSPDAKWIALGVGDAGEIQALRTDGTSRHVLARGAGYVGGDWSSDDRRLVAVARDGTVSIVGGKRPISLGHGESPRWEPHGGLIAFDDANGRLVLVRSDGSHRRVLGRAVPGTAAWSPDGRRLAYVAATSMWTPLRELELTRSRTFTLVRTAVGRPVWSPDSRRLLADGGRGDSQPMRLLEIRADGGTIRAHGIAGPDPGPLIAWMRGRWLVSIYLAI